MGKFKKTLPFMLVMFLAACGTKVVSSEIESSNIEESTSNEESSENSEPMTKVEQYKTKRETSIIADTNFRNGFNLISPESTNQYKEKDLDYNGEAETDTYGKGDRFNYWDMCQWWTPFNFKEAIYRKEGNTHMYENESRYLGVNCETGELTMKLDADLEYQEKFGGIRDQDASWSHFLIQQSFPQEIAINPANIDTANYGLVVNFDIQIDKAEYKRAGTPAGSDCAQLMFYLLLRNDVPTDSDPNEVGKRNLKFWFGMPIFDTRYDTVAQYIAGDVGFEGATGHLIYSIPSKTYLGSKALEMGKKYSVNIDVLEYVQQAFIYGVQNNYLKNCQWQNMKLDYMNFGWEIPGNYAVSSTISNLDVYVG